MNNEILNGFLETIKEAQSNGDDTLLDIREIMNKEQFKQFRDLEKVVHTLFSAENLFEGVKETVDGKQLSDEQQICVLAIVKLFETFVAGMSKAQDKLDSSDVNGGSDGMYI